MFTEILRKYYFYTNKHKNFYRLSMIKISSSITLKNKELYKGFYQSPFGRIIIALQENVIVGIEFTEPEESFPHILDNHSKIQQAGDAIFTQQPLSIAFCGTSLQEAVWHSLLEIPKGELRNYEQIALAIGKPKAVRAVATAIGKNPIPYIIPCHRMIRKDGSLGGFSGGLHFKKKLLSLEGIPSTMYKNTSQKISSAS